MNVCHAMCTGTKPCYMCQQVSVMQRTMYRCCKGWGLISPGHLSASVLAAVEGWQAARWQPPVSWCSEASSNGGNASCALQLTCLACDCAVKILSKTWEGDHVRLLAILLHFSPGNDRDWHLSKQAGHIKLLSLPLCNELMVELRLVLFLQQIWVCQQQAFGCVWESDNSSQLTQQSLQQEALSVSVSPATISLSKLNLAAACPQN